MRALLAALTLLAAAPAAGAAERFPRGFLWGTATAGFQVEAGGRPSHADRGSDWWAWATSRSLAGQHVVSGDSPAAGPGEWTRWRTDLKLARTQLHSNAIRLGIEWSRIFPRSTRSVAVGARPSLKALRKLDRLADHAAVAHYRAVLRSARRRGLRVMLTLNHFTLPRWVHDPLAVRAAFARRGLDDPVPAGLKRAGWLDRRTVKDFRAFAAYAAWKLGGDVNRWATLNEPLVQASQGYASIPGVTGAKPPGVFNLPAAVLAVKHLALGNAAAYDAIKAVRPKASVGFVQNLLDWRPSDPAKAADRRAAAHASRVFNRLFLDAAVRGRYDLNANGRIGASERHPSLRGKADWIGVNYYSPAYATGLPAPLSPKVPLFDFTPTSTFRGHGAPNGAPCPSTCSDFGWVIDPSGLGAVLQRAAKYGRPLYVTENGIDDAADAKRPAFLAAHLREVRRAIRAGVRVRGYFHWSLVDNFEWSEGVAPKFGLYAYDAKTLARRARPSARLFARIAKANALP